MPPALAIAIPLLGGLLALALGGFVLLRGARSAPTRYFALGMGSIAVMELALAAALGLGPGQPGGAWAYVSVTALVLFPAPWMAFSLTFGRAAGGAAVGRGRFALAATVLLSAAGVAALWTGRFFTAGFMLSAAGYWVSALLVVALTAIVANFEATFRSATRGQRWRIKYLVLGVGSIIVAMIYLFSQMLLFAVIGSELPLVVSTVVLIGCAVVGLALARQQPLGTEVVVSRY